MSGQSDGIEEPPKVWPYHIRKLWHLDAAAKCFLYTVLSHQDGFMYRSAKNAADDMGISLSLFYRTRKKLLKHMVIWETQNPGHTTLYQVNPWAVHSWLEIQHLNSDELRQRRERKRLEKEQEESTPSQDDSPTPIQSDRGV